MTFKKNLYLVLLLKVSVLSLLLVLFSAEDQESMWATFSPAYAAI